MEESDVPIAMSVPWFGPSTKDIYRIVEDSVSLLRKLMVRLIIFLNDFLILAASIEELILALENLIYLPEGLGFVINIKKSVLQPCQNLEFLGVEINSKHIVLVIPEEKKNKIVEQCQFLLKKPLLTMINLKSGDMLVSLNSHCSSASTSTVSSSARPENNGVFQGKKLQFKDKLLKGV